MPDGDGLKQPTLIYKWWFLEYTCVKRSSKYSSRNTYEEGIACRWETAS